MGNSQLYCIQYLHYEQKTVIKIIAVALRPLN